MEPPLVEPPVGSNEPGSVEVTFELVEEASKQRKTKLIDSLGYTYNVKGDMLSVTVCQCSVRTKSIYCKATVKQLEDQFNFSGVRLPTFSTPPQPELCCDKYLL